MTQWHPIKTAPRDRVVKLRGRVEFSREHARNTGVSEIMEYAEGRWLWGDTWSMFLGGKPQEWAELTT